MARAINTKIINTATTRVRRKQDRWGRMSEFDSVLERNSCMIYNILKFFNENVLLDELHN
jgi:hypothetical protein